MNELVHQCIVCKQPTKYKNGKCSGCYEKEKTKNKESEGEIYLSHLFKKWGIKFEKQKKIEGLQNDSKSYRVADFYLPKFNVYIEFNGHYRDHREQYDEKIRVYKLNRIPCVFIYPENLGFIQFTFDQRIQKVLTEYEMFKQLKAYRLLKLKEEGLDKIVKFIFLFAGLVASIVLSKSLSKNIEISILLILACMYHAYSFYLIWKSIYKDNSYYDIFK
jgi:very-short-patch-repair endonuclease